MTLEEAIKERIKNYYNANFDEEGLETNKLTKSKYDRQYFDTFEEEVLSKKGKNNGNSKK